MALVAGLDRPCCASYCMTISTPPLSLKSVLHIENYCTYIMYVYGFDMYIPGMLSHECLNAEVY